MIWKIKIKPTIEKIIRKEIVFPQPIGVNNWGITLIVINRIKKEAQR